METNKMSLLYKLFGIPQDKEEIIDKARRHHTPLNVLLQEYNISSGDGHFGYLGDSYFGYLIDLEVLSNKINIKKHINEPIVFTGKMVSRTHYYGCFGGRYKGYEKVWRSMNNKELNEFKDKLRKSAVKEAIELAKEIQKDGLDVKINNESVERWEGWEGNCGKLQIANITFKSPYDLY